MTQPAQFKIESESGSDLTLQLDPFSFVIRSDPIFKTRPISHPGPLQLQKWKDLIFRPFFSCSETDSNHFRGVRFVGDTPLCPSGSQVRSRSNHCFNRIKKIRARDNNCHWYCKDRENDITRKVKLEAFSLTVFMTQVFNDWRADMDNYFEFDDRRVWFARMKLQGSANIFK